MKKTLALLIGIGIFAVSCVEKAKPELPIGQTTVANPTTSPDPDPDPDYAQLCKEYSDLEDGSEEQKIWIEKHKTEICDGKFFACVTKNHSISDSLYNEMVKKYWKHRLRKKKSFTWIDVEAKVNTLDCMKDEYLGFKLENEKVVGLKTIKGYTKSETCYSASLFRAIDTEVKGLQKDDLFEFILGTDNKNATSVIFKIKRKVGILYFDLTVDPLFYLTTK